MSRFVAYCLCACLLILPGLGLAQTTPSDVTLTTYQSYSKATHQITIKTGFTIPAGSSQAPILHRRDRGPG